MLLGATADRGYVEIEGDGLRVRFGWLFDKTYGIADVESVRSSGWPLIGGIGWRMNLRDLVGLIGARTGVVEVHFRQKQRGWMVLPYSIRRLAISLEAPDAFIAALQSLLQRNAP